MGAASVKHTRLKAIKQCSKIRFSRSHFTIGPHLKCDVLCLWIEKSCNTHSSNICPGDHGEQPHPVSLLCSHFPSVSIAVCDCNQLTRMIALCSKSRYHHCYANKVVSLRFWQAHQAVVRSEMLCLQNCNSSSHGSVESSNAQRTDYEFGFARRSIKESTRTNNCVGHSALS